MNMKKITAKRHFTVTELLVAITLIVVLMGIMLPGIAKVKQRAHTAVARTEVKSLLMAIQLYEQTFGYLPLLPESADRALTDNEYALLIGFLQGNNARGMEMLAPQQKWGKGTWTDNTSSESTWTNDGYYYDPFRTTSGAATELRYRVAMDLNYSGAIEDGTNPISALSERIYSTVAIWSDGPNRTNEEGAGDDVTSWK